MKDLKITDWTTGIELRGHSGNAVKGSYIGTGGSAAQANDTGVLINGSPSSTVGGTSAPARNVISGNTTAGIELSDTTKDAVEGNYIGTNAAGTAALPNGTAGVSIDSSSASDTIGGTTTGARNVISGNGSANSGAGILLSAARSCGRIVETHPDRGQLHRHKRGGKRGGWKRIRGRRCRSVQRTGPVRRHHRGRTQRDLGQRRQQ